MNYDCEADELKQVIMAQGLVNYSVFEACPKVTAFSTMRQGGCSTGNYASLNCTPYTGDNPEAVQSNQALLCTALSIRPEQLIIPFQTHGTERLLVDEAFLQSTAPERTARLQGVDALITSQPNVCLCISTADCIPVLLYDRRHHIAAAIHAGWRGTVNRILRQTLGDMHRLFATEGNDVLAAIGPGISLAAFEVGDEVYEAFRTAHFPMDYIAQWHPDIHKWHLDLPAANALQLLDFGVPQQQLQLSHLCTYTRHEEFFSARRLGIRSGRILTGIMIRQCHQ